MTARYIIGDAFEALATLEPDSVDLILTSPPFLALRSYLPADHEHKAHELGSEATPADFLDALLDVVEACDRVLAPHGSLVFELGDTYAGSGGAGGDYAESGNRHSQPEFAGSMSAARRYQGAVKTAKPGTDSRAQSGLGWPLSKSLCMISTLFPACLAYGRNLLRPERETPRWRIRNVIVWARPNPPVGALGDKFRPATSYLTVACKSDRRWFDLDAVREPPVVPLEQQNRWHANGQYAPETGSRGDDGMQHRHGGNPAGAPPLDYWEIPTQPYAGAHYATWPSKLCVKPILAMAPQKVCRVCGEPSRRIVEKTEEYAAFRASKNAGEHGTTAHTENVGNRAHGWDHQDDSAARGDTHRTLGWSDCGHDDYRPGMVLDPFAGSGTTLAVATGHGRDAVGIDIDSRNANLALERVGPLFLTVETLAPASGSLLNPTVDVETEVV